jgi:hypothetical protein
LLNIEPAFEFVAGLLKWFTSPQSLYDLNGIGLANADGTFGFNV